MLRVCGNLKSPWRGFTEEDLTFGILQQVSVVPVGLGHGGLLGGVVGGQGRYAGRAHGDGEPLLLGTLVGLALRGGVQRLTFPTGGDYAIVIIHIKRITLLERYKGSVCNIIQPWLNVAWRLPCTCLQPSVFPATTIHYPSHCMLEGKSTFQYANVFHDKN